MTSFFLTSSQSGTFDAEDDEADLVYQAVEQHLDTRRKKRREERLKEELELLQKVRSHHYLTSLTFTPHLISLFYFTAPTSPSQLGLNFTSGEAEDPGPVCGCQGGAQGRFI